MPTRKERNNHLSLKENQSISSVHMAALAGSQYPSFLIFCRSCNQSLQPSNFTDRQVRKYKQEQKLLASTKSSSPSSSFASTTTSAAASSVICSTCTDNCFVSKRNDDILSYYLPSSSSHCHLIHPPSSPISGIKYYANFLSSSDHARILEIVDGNPWRKVIKRRQQFYGEVYYHTTRENTELQPGDSRLRVCEDREDALPLSQFAWLEEKLSSPEWKDKLFGDLPFPTQVLVSGVEI